MCDTSASLELDVAVIGAGAAGLYSAYRLLEPNATKHTSPFPKSQAQRTNCNASLKVAVFEASSRLGGRVCSAHFKPGNVPGELGAMRYLSNQRIVASLVEQVLSVDYNLKSVPFDYGNSEEVLFYTRSRRFRAKDLPNMDYGYNLGYCRAQRWRGKGVDEIYEDIVDEVLKADGDSLDRIKSDPAQVQKRWDDTAKTLRYRFKGPFENRLVHELAFWHVIADRVDSETCAFLKDADGYNCSFAQLSATEGFQMVCDCTDSVEYRTVEGGFDRLFHALGAEVEKSGGKIWTNTHLVSFHRPRDQKSDCESSEDRYELRFRDEKKNSTWTAFARQILLCIPRCSLQLLQSVSPPLQTKRFTRNLKTVVPVPALKILLSFEEAWWVPTIGLKGKAITDLPIRQSYFFGASNPETACSVVTSSYVDSEAVVFWRCAQDLDRNVNRKLVCESQSRDTSTHETANMVVISEARRQMQAVLGPDVKVPNPTGSAFIDWSTDPFGGAYHFWKPGVKPWQVAEEMRHPFGDEEVYVAGECYSGTHGWVESAFLSAERVLRDVFEVAEAGWLKGNGSYYLGW
eukprot:GFKZ01001388.1.p1 GENE.GFKZ01001388.1~~GFKZ01001388.1.p1  ORF type:complete len:573 (-),score=44.55 GFKZ01001388.1:922-2640(-)